MIRLAWGTCAVLMLVVSCDRPGPAVDFALVDSLMMHGQPHLADSLIHAGLSRARDSLTIRKLNHRLRLIDIQRFYSPLYRSLQNGDTVSIRRKAREKVSGILKQDSSEGRWYLLDSWVLRAKLDSLAGKMKGWAEKQTRALEYPTTQPYRKIDITLSLAAHAMDRERYEEARAHLDNALRRFPKADLTAKLTPVYLLYMNGHFDRAYQELNRLPEKDLRGRWRRIKIFLQKYRDKLTLKDRFKLW